VVRGRWAALALLAAACAGAGPSVRPGAGGGETTFRYQGSADEVWLVGSMTGWQPVPLSRDGGRWVLRLPLAPGRHEYRLEVREKGVTRVEWPPGAERVDDGFGGENAILRVER
jgi:hypothetical protein